MHDEHLSPDTRAIIAALHESEHRRDTVDDKKHLENKRRIESILETQRRMEDEIAGISKGFPNGDPESHRRYHESVIEWRELRNKMVREALTNAAKVGGVGAIGWLAYALWTALKMEVMK